MMIVDWFDIKIGLLNKSSISAAALGVIINNPCYEFGHTLLSCSSPTKMFNKPP
jgi:hypothetical protein